MALAFQMAGPVLVQWDNANLGYAEDKVTIQIQPFFDDIHTDAWGGLAGPFAERQLLGAIANIQVVFTKYDDTLVNALSSYDAAGAVGMLPEIGSFVYQDNLYGPLELNGTKEQITFAYAHLGHAQEFNSSTRHRKYVAGWIARLNDVCTNRQLFTLVESTISCTQ